MRRAAIVMPMRTPVGLPEGALAAVAPHRLMATVLTAVLGRSGIDPTRIDHLVTAVPTPHTARTAAEHAGLPPTIGEFPVDSGPGSGMRALITAAMMVQSGAADVVLAVGAEYPWGAAESAAARPGLFDAAASRSTGAPQSGPIPAFGAPENTAYGAASVGGGAMPTGAAWTGPIPAVPPGESGPIPSVSTHAGAESGPIAQFSHTGGVDESGPIPRFSHIGGADESGPIPRFSHAAGADESGSLPRTSAQPGVNFGPAGLIGPGAGATAAVRSAGPVRAALERIEDLALHYGISRAQADEFAAISHRRAARARRQGVFGAETAPVVVCADPNDMNSGVVQLVDRDEGLRDDVSPRAFATVMPLLPGGVVTTANSSARTFAASACLVVAEDRLADLGLNPMGYLVGWATGTAESGQAQTDSTVAASKVLSRTGFDLADIDLVEIDESDAVEVLASHHLWGDWDPEGDRLNVHGGAIALGDPGGAAALRMVTTLLHELSRREGGSGLAITSSGPSQSLAALFESPHARPVAPTPKGARFHGVRTRRSGRHRA